MNKFSITHKFILFFVASAIIGFCLNTNSDGDYRIYRAVDLPLVIQMNENSPSSYDSVIEEALLTWNNVEGAYFDFAMGVRTTVSVPGGDGINLLYFDNNYDNFAPGSNTIAFSSTRTSNVGGYHAVESDYIYNAAGYPPATDGNPTQMDLMTLTLHEVGHHVGLSHHGPAGNSNGGGSAGCGPNLPNQVMYWSISDGVLKRELFIHDEMGVVALYPNYIISGEVTDIDSGTPVQNAKIVFNEGTYGAYVGPVENAVGRNMRPGDVYNEAPSLEDGSYVLAMNKKSFSFYVEKFGYEPTEAIDIDFNEASGYGNTQEIVNDFQLTKTERVSLSGIVTNTKTGEGTQSEVIVTWVGDQNETQNIVANEDGSYAFDIPSNAYYKVEFYFDPPFKSYYKFDSVFVGSTGATLNLDVTPVSLLFVYDGNNATYAADYRNTLDKLGADYVEWSSDMEGGSLQSESLEQYSQPLTILWVAGGENSSNLTSADITLMENHLANGQRLILCGRNIVEYEDSNGTLISEYAGVEHGGNSSGIRALGFDGDKIGDGISTLMLGAGKDILTYSGKARGNVNKVLYYGASIADSNNIGAVRSENENEGWKFVLFSDGLDKMSKTAIDSLLSRSIKYTGSSVFVTGVDVDLRNNEVLNAFTLSQNYPNPFNPSTTIKFALPVNSNVTLKIFNVLGEEVEVIKSGFMNAGNYEFRWDASNSKISSGIYFYHIEADGINGSRFMDAKKMILIK